MKTIKLFLVVIYLLVGSGLLAQVEHILGTVVDLNTNKPIGQADITIVGKNIFGRSDDNGLFTFQFPKGTSKGDVIRVRVSKTGYKLWDSQISVTSLIPIPVKLEKIGDSKKKASTRKDENGKPGTDLEGELLPPKNAKKLDDIVVIIMGTDSDFLPKRQLAKGYGYVSKLHSIPLTFYFENDALFISVKIKDLSGKIVAEMEKNNWSINPNNYFRTNHDRSAVEVIDQDGNVAFQAEIISKNRVKIAGIFNNTRDSVIHIINADYIYQISYNVDLKKMYKAVTKKSFEEMYEDEAGKIKRIFRYTGKDQAGKRI